MKDQQYTKKEIVNICLNRLERELKKEEQDAEMPIGFLDGYNTAINDIIWDLFGETPVVSEQREWLYKKVKEGKIKLREIPIDKIKTNQ